MESIAFTLVVYVFIRKLRMEVFTGWDNGIPTNPGSQGYWNSYKRTIIFQSENFFFISKVQLVNLVDYNSSTRHKEELEIRDQQLITAKRGSILLQKYTSDQRSVQQISWNDRTNYVTFIGTTQLKFMSLIIERLKKILNVMFTSEIQWMVKSRDETRRKIR